MWNEIINNKTLKEFNEKFYRDYEKKSVNKILL